MRAIQPVNVWVKGTQRSANNLDMKITYDNLSTKAIFRYYLIAVSSFPEQVAVQQEDGSVIIETHTSYINDILIDDSLEISGPDYQNWGNTGDPNQEAYVWACQQLNLTLL